jgi:hypothetical protein
MKSLPAWLSYSVIRLLLFAVPLVILLVAGVDPIVATIIAAIVGLCLSYIFLRTPRARVAESVYRARHRESAPTSADADYEDAAVDRRTSVPDLSEGEGGTEQQPEGERRETGEFQRKHELP